LLQVGSRREVPTLNKVDCGWSCCSGRHWNC
jgi:hypothetical protein